MIIPIDKWSVFVPQVTFDNVWRHGCHNRGGRVPTSIQWVETRNAVKHPTMHRAGFNREPLFYILLTSLNTIFMISIHSAKRIIQLLLFLATKYPTVSIPYLLLIHPPVINT